MSQRVLVVDDDVQFRRAIVPTLERRGLRVVEAGTGHEASAALASGRFVLAIVDGILPDANGVAWVAQLRARGDETPVLYVTAFPHDRATVTRLTKELGVAQVLFKPIIPSVFGSIVDHLLASSPAPPSSNGDAVRAADDDEIPPSLVREYEERLPQRTKELAEAVSRARADERDDAAWRDARKRAHDLRGTAGTYGFAAVGQAAGRVEDALVAVLSAGRGPDGAEARARAWDEAEGAARELARTEGEAMAAVVARVLVVDADAKVRAELALLGRERCVLVTAVETAQQALARAAGESFDAALIDAALPARAAFQLARDLRGLPRHGRLPIAFMSSDGALENRVAAAHAGGSLYLAKPIDPYVFGAAIEQLLALSRDERTRVLIVDDDADFAECLAASLEHAGIAAATLTDPARVLEVVEEQSPDLLLLDVMLPGVSGFDVARMLRTTPRWQDVPILFLTGRTDLESRVAAFDAGGDDYLAKPIVEEELVARVRVRLDRRRLMREMTEKDPLTKLLSRRALLEALASRVSESRRHGRRLSLALLDVDRFKQINDAHGHLLGDQVLATLGRLLAERFRLEDLRGRWGGEEFVIVFPGENADTAAGVLRRVLAEFRAHAFRDEKGRVFHVTFSAGVASFPEDGGTVEALLKAADRRLYQAKDAGRSRVVGVPNVIDTPGGPLPFQSRSTTLRS